MKVLRQVKMNVEHFKVGDQITVKVKGYGKYTVTVHKVVDDKALVIFNHCITNRPMNENGSNDGGFTASDLCKWLNGEFLNALPDKLRSRIVPDEEHGGVMARVPTQGEIFGQNDASEYYEPDGDEQLTLMKDRKNRVCVFPNDEYVWYWLMNTRRDTATNFAVVDYNGLAGSGSAFTSIGVRPVFEIRNL